MSQIVVNCAGGVGFYRWGVLGKVVLPDNPRFWLADKNATYSLAHTICTPDDMPVGDYELHLNLPDPEPSLYLRSVLNVPALYSYLM